jgi:hypothetical protein
MQVNDDGKAFRHKDRGAFIHWTALLSLAEEDPCG